jgi:tetratricopeptide (TPR) repeat protein
VTLSLSALSDEDTARLIAEHLAQAVLPAEMQQTLLRRADGNPLFAEEYIRMLRDRGLLHHEGGSWRLERTDVDVPATVQGIIAARLDALEQDEKAVLQTASVVGKVFWLGSVAAIAELSAWDAEERLHALERKEFVRRDRRASVAGETEYSVRHVLVRDVAYGQIPRARRADLHVRAARWIESLGADRSEDRAEMLAHHYVAALDLTRAAGGDVGPLERPARQALREAGNRAYALSALQSAADLYQKALDLWPRDDPTYPRLLFELGQTLLWWRNQGAPEFEEAAELLLASGAVEEAALAEAGLANVHWTCGAQQLARSHYARAIELIDGLAETRSTAHIRGDAWRAMLLANAHPSLEEGRRILALAEELGSTADILTARINLGLGHAYHGDPQAAIRDLQLALDQCLEANSHLATRACLNLGSITGTAGDLGRSARLHREGVELARRFGSFAEKWLLAECAVDDYTGGVWDAAVAGATAFLEHQGATQYMEVGARGVLAATFAARGARREADEHAQIMLVRAREIGDPQALWGALGTSARLAVETGERGEGRSLVRELAAALAADESFQIEVYELDGFVAAAALGLGHELGDHLEKAAYDSPWVQAAVRIADGRLEEAGETLEASEAHTYAAMVRLLAAELVGRETPGLREALAFYESVGAAAYLSRAERFLHASA